jgi:hypothetical protein
LKLSASGAKLIGQVFALVEIISLTAVQTSLLPGELARKPLLENLTANPTTFLHTEGDYLLKPCLNSPSFQVEDEILLSYYLLLLVCAGERYIPLGKLNNAALFLFTLFSTL